MILLPFLLWLVGLSTACLDETYVTWDSTNYTLSNALMQLCNGGTINLVGSDWGASPSHCEVSITKNVTIQSAGNSSVTFRCGARPFFIFEGPGTLAIQRLNFVDGTSPIGTFSNVPIHLEIEGCRFSGFSQKCPLGIDAAPVAITVRESWFEGNSFGAISVWGSLEVTNSVFFNNSAPNGGAIYINGPATIDRCEFVYNRAYSGYGGAIAVGPEDAGVNVVTITKSMFDSNQAITLGGAIYTSFDVDIDSVAFRNNSAATAGAIAAHNADISITLFTMNTAQISGGALYTTGSLTLDETSFQDNNVTDSLAVGGAIWASDRFHINYSEFLNNNAGPLGAGGAMYSASTSEGNSLQMVRFLNNQAQSGGAIYLANGCQIQEANFSGNVATLYGGAIFKSGTSALVITNAEATHNVALNGGVIYATSGSTLLTSCTMSHNSAPTDPSAMHRIMESMLVVPRPYAINTTWLATGGFGGAVFCQSAEFSESQFADNEAAVAGGAVFATDFSAYRSDFIGNAASSGGAIYALNSIQLRVSKFSENVAEQLGGGALAVPEGSVSVDRCLFTQNTAQEWGGAIQAGLLVETSHAEFEANIGSSGGALYTSQLCLLHGTRLHGNQAMGGTDTEGAGGAIYCAIEAKVDQCDFSYNQARSDGGAVAAPVITSQKDLFRSNIAGRHGGACIADTVTSDLSAFLGNQAAGDGGALLVAEDIACQGTSFEGNSCKQRGGAVYLTTQPNFAHVQFINNTAVKGGAIYAAGEDWTLVLRGVTFVHNQAVLGAFSPTPCGGAIMSEAAINISDCLFRSNAAVKGGGAVYHWQALAVENSAFLSNTAEESGGAIYGEYGNASVVYIQSSSFVRNGARMQDGGAVFSATVLHANSSSFEYNSAARNGGAIWADGLTYIDHCDFTSNTAHDGGALYALVDMDAWGSTFTQNQAVNNGGALWVATGLNAHLQSMFGGNKAGNFGGAVYGNPGAIISVTNVNFDTNQATFGAGIFGDQGTDVSAEESVFIGNKALQRGPAFYHLTRLMTRNNTFLNNDSPLDGGRYLNAWFSPTDRRSIGTLTLSWLVSPELTVGNVLQVELPKELELNQCGSDYVGDCHSNISLDGMMMDAPYSAVADVKTNIITIRWDHNGTMDMQQAEMYVLQVDAVRTPNHCGKLTFTVAMRHCVARDVLGIVGDVVTEDCHPDLDDYTHTTTFLTEEPAGTPKGCNACNACFYSDIGVWRCHHGSVGEFSRSYLDETCNALS